MGLAFLAASVQLTAAACASGSAQVASDGPALPELSAHTRVASNADVLDTPFNGLFESQSQLAAERDAYERLMSQCAGRAGHRFVPDSSYHPVVMLYDFALPFGPVDPQRARRFGYHDPAFREGPQAPHWQGKESPAALTESCHAEAVRRLGGERPTVALTLADQAHERAVADPRWAAAVQSWTDCMHDRGYSYRYPLDPIDAYANKAGPPTRKEIASAVADVSCKHSTREIETIVQLLTAYETQALDNATEEFTRYSTWKVAYLRNVARVLRSISAPANRFWLTDHGPQREDPSDLGGA